MIKVYRFDKDGYFLKDEMVFEDPKNPSKPMLPPDCTEEAPNIEKGYFARYVNGSWTNEKIPTTCDEAINMGFTCISNGPEVHNLLKKTVIKSLVQADSEHFKTVVGDNFEMSIEAIPEPTEEEKIAKLSTELRAKRDAELDATDFYLMPDYPISGSDLTLIQRYRQELRDLPQQEGFPYVDFPVNPLTPKVEE